MIIIIMIQMLKSALISNAILRRCTIESVFVQIFSEFHCSKISAAHKTRCIMYDTIKYMLHPSQIHFCLPLQRLGRLNILSISHFLQRKKQLSCSSWRLRSILWYNFQLKIKLVVYSSHQLQKGVHH